jgi:hypothetical protein
MPSQPADPVLYDKVKKDIYRKYPKHSAYRSGHLVKAYKEQFSEKYGSKKSPYKGEKTRKKGLSRWFAEKWSNQRGESGYKFKHDVYRPTIRVTKDTPVLLEELTDKQIEAARREKYEKGRVYKFDKKKTQKKGGNKMSPRRGGVTPSRSRSGKLHFFDYPEFQPNLTPREIFQLGSFGGTYWRPIQSKFYKLTLKNQHKKYPASWWKGIPESHLTSSVCDISLNKYKVRVGTSLAFWEEKGWMHPSQPYGWVQWYCDFYDGKRGEDDERQIDRWMKLAGPNGRFFRYLVTLIIQKDGKWNDEEISPKIRQTLQHWAYKLTESDYDSDLKRRKKEK